MNRVETKPLGFERTPARVEEALGGVGAAGLAAGARRGPDRLPGASGVDPSAEIAFTWEGRTLWGRAGDTLSAALLANGVDLVGRSFKYHRPRGVTSAGVEEAGAIVTTGRRNDRSDPRRTPNVNASTLELTEGASAFAQNAWPSVAFDAMALNGVVDKALGPVFAAGFYYKTFFSALPFGARGSSHWMAFERFIRRAAGMGALSEAADPDAYETRHAHCDALVIGSGPAGLAAARALAEAGQDVLVVEQDFALGGRLLADRTTVEGDAPGVWADAQIQAARAAGARFLTRAAAFGLYDGGVAGLVERVGAPNLRERLWTVRAERIVLATGAVERGLAFGDNDRPGVMSAGALRSYANRFGVLPGRKIALVASDDGAYADLDRLQEAGAEVTALDLRSAADAKRDPAAEQWLEAAPLRALGGRRVRGLRAARRRPTGWRVEDLDLECDLIAVSGGWRPSLELLAQRGAPLIWDAERGAHVAGPQPGRSQPQSEPAVEICGAAQALDDPDACAASGRAAADRILGRPAEAIPGAPGGSARAVYFEIAPPRGRDAKTKRFVDLQHDVTAEDVRLAAREGYVSVEHVKRYTTLGMATDQGKTSNLIGLGVLAEARGCEVGDLGTTGFRPPYIPVSLGALAGERRRSHRQPTRRTPMDQWHRDRGAVMTDAGLWRRAWYYPSGSEGLDAAYVREAAAVRETVGLCDVSTLGKILLQGPGAAAFLDRVYVGMMSTLAVGRARYGVMLREDGMAFDDGTVWRLGETEYLITTTTAGAGKVMSWLEKLAQTRWPELDLAMVSVSDRLAGFSVAGPLARRLLSERVAGVKFDDASFPPMGVRRGRIGGAPAWIARLSFSGELAYEVMVEADHGAALADALWDAAEPMGGVLYGTEALGALRIEKGHVAGPELDGRTTLSDLGLGAMDRGRKPYVGRALALREATAAGDRPRLAGFIAADGVSTFRAGGIVCVRGDVQGHGIGWISSVTQSPAMNRWIGLGLVRGGADAWRGKTLIVADPVRGAQTRVRAVSPHFFDPDGGRLKPDADPAAPEASEPRRPVGRLHRVSALGTVWPVTAEGRLNRRTPARASYGRARIDDVETPALDRGDGPVWIVEGAPNRLRRVVAWPGREAAMTKWLRATYGPEAAPGFGRAAALGEGRSSLRIGPLAWMVVEAEEGPDPGTDDAAAWEAAARDAASRDAPAAPSPCDGAAADLSHGIARIRVGGRLAAALLNSALALDLRETRFAVDATATTDLMHTPAVLHRVDHAAYDLYVLRSYAADFWDLLERGARRLS